MKKRICILLTFVLLFLAPHTIQAQKTSNDGNNGPAERAYLVNALTQIADPVLDALSKNQLRKLMPVEAKNPKNNAYSTHLEAFGRLLAGIAPWLELGPDNTPEGKLRKKYIDLTLTCIRNGTDPASPDFLNFNKGGGQPVVDAAFFAQGLLRAPHQVWDKLDAATQANVIAALKSSRVITPNYSNWLLFSAIIEAALLKFDKSGDRMRMDYAIKEHLNNWYKGDGAYGDGPNFHWDYYNSFVIQPMLVQTLATINGADSSQKRPYAQALAHIKRYAAVQERMISPEGTYPVIGRSLAYRFGAFQALAMVSLMRELPENVKPQQVRAALYTMIKRQMEAPQTFDSKGWLQIGMYGHQPNIGESYISTGSLYLCAEGFLMLGLPASDPFWQGPDEDWTAKKVWKGIDVPIDHALDDK
jgi:hypothetical protein